MGFAEMSSLTDLISRVKSENNRIKKEYRLLKIEYDKIFLERSRIPIPRPRVNRSTQTNLKFVDKTTQTIVNSVTTSSQTPVIHCDSIESGSSSNAASSTGLYLHIIFIFITKVLVRLFQHLLFKLQEMI